MTSCQRINMDIITKKYFILQGKKEKQYISTYETPTYYFRLFLKRLPLFHWLAFQYHSTNRALTDMVKSSCSSLLIYRKIYLKQTTLVKNMGLKNRVKR